MTEPREQLAHALAEQRKAILAYEPGPELDALVAEKIVSLTPCDGWMPVNFGSAGGPALAKRCDHAPDTCYSTRTLGSIQGRIGGAPRYSTDPGAAWLVVERLRDSGHVIEIRLGSNDRDVAVMVLPSTVVDVWRFDAFRVVTGSFALSACRAALLATFEARPR